jgi:hypothetical protein
VITSVSDNQLAPAISGFEFLPGHGGHSQELAVRLRIIEFARGYFSTIALISADTIDS